MKKIRHTLQLEEVLETKVFRRCKFNVHRLAETSKCHFCIRTYHDERIAVLAKEIVNVDEAKNSVKNITF